MLTNRRDTQGGTPYLSIRGGQSIFGSEILQNIILGVCELQLNYSLRELQLTNNSKLLL